MQASAITRTKPKVTYTLLFLASNALVIFAFTVLWCLQGRMSEHLSKMIDRVCMPWGWLIGFYAASFFPLQKILSLPKAAIVSLVSACVISFFEWIFVQYLFDPMF